MHRRNFTDVARERGLAPSSVSRTITGLENEFGIRLFQRTTRKLDPMKFAICASPDYLRRHGKPRAPEDVKNHSCLLFPRSGHNLDWLFKDKGGKITRIPVTGKCLITNSQAIKQCTKSAMGLALLPNWLVNEDIKSGALIRLFEEFDVSATDYDSAVWLLYPSRDYVPLKARVFMDHLITSFRDKTVHSGVP